MALTRMLVTRSPTTYMTEEQAEVMEAWLRLEPLPRRVLENFKCDIYIVNPLSSGAFIRDRRVTSTVRLLMAKQWATLHEQVMLNMAFQLNITPQGEMALLMWRNLWPRIDGMPSPRERGLDST